jgi:hypothetical protein
VLTTSQHCLYVCSYSLCIPFSTSRKSHRANPHNERRNNCQRRSLDQRSGYKALDSDCTDIRLQNVVVIMFSWIILRTHSFLQIPKKSSYIFIPDPFISSQFTGIAPCLTRNHNLRRCLQQILLLHCLSHCLEPLALRVHRDGSLVRVTVTSHISPCPYSHIFKNKLLTSRASRTSGHRLSFPFANGIVVCRARCP